MINLLKNSENVTVDLTAELYMSNYILLQFMTAKDFCTATNKETAEENILLLESTIKYFESIEDYEKCHKLHMLYSRQ